MQLARVIATVVATRKDPRLEGFKLLVVRLQSAEGQDESGYLVAVDMVGAGAGERVLVVQGSSARMARDGQDKPIDAAIVGIVDTVEAIR
jgi:ethanolamine utilization protein EutN